MPSPQQLRPAKPESTGQAPGWIRRCAGYALLACLTTSFTAAQAPPPPAKSLNELKGFFQQHCTRCHGLDGSARSPEGKPLGGLDFTRAAKDFQALPGPASEREVRTMIRTIRQGIFFGLTMPSWKAQLTTEDAALMVREILLQAQAGKVIQPDPEAPQGASSAPTRTE